MKTVSAREVQHEFSRYLAKASRGEVVLITKHGKKMAQLSPVPEERKTELVWPDFEARLRKHFPDGAPLGKPASEIISESREERF